LAIVRSDTPRLLEVGLRTIFFQQYNAPVTHQADLILTNINSTKDKEKYGWIGAGPGMRKFDGERRPKGVKEYGFEIENEIWESSIEVERKEIEDDQYGQIKLRAQGLATDARRHRDELTFATLQLGFSKLCYDGQYFFDTDHLEGKSGTQINKVVTAFSAAALQTAITTMKGYKDDQGRVLGIIPNLLVVGPALENTADEVLNNEYAPIQVSGHSDWRRNQLNGKLKLEVTPFITDSSWYVFCTTGIVKPLIWQDRIPIEFGSLEGNSEQGFMRDKYIYGVRARYNVGFGPWQMAYGSTGTG
jgi:phage major head subunit gpT-like protein